MSDVMALYRSNLAKMGLDQPIPEEQPVQPARRTVAPPTAPVQVVQAPTPAPVPVAQAVQAASAMKAVQADTRVADLEQRVSALEKLLRPILADKPIAEIDRIAADYAMLTEKGMTEGLPYHKYRTMKRTARHVLLRKAANV